MTEEEWLSTHDPEAVIDCWRGRWNDRSLRHIMVGLVRRVVLLVDNPPSRKIAEGMDYFADGTISRDELWDKGETCEMFEAFGYPWGSHRKPLYDEMIEAILWILYPALPDEAICSGRKDISNMLAETPKNSSARKRGVWICDTVRDIFGNPFRPVVADVAWLTPTVQSIASAIYQDRTFDRLPILADALEDAGCTNADVLRHCRQLGEHVRGCWVVDLVLGKE